MTVAMKRAAPIRRGADADSIAEAGAAVRSATQRLEQLQQTVADQLDRILILRALNQLDSVQESLDYLASS